MTTPKADPATLELRAPPPRATRLSRRNIVGVLAAVASAIFGLALWSLHLNRPLGVPATSVLDVDHVSRAEGLDRLPGDYSKIPEKAAPTPPPVLGPPLPGDLGTAMLRAQQERPDLAAPPLGRPSPPDPDLERARVATLDRQREEQEAAKSALFFRGAPNRTTASAQHVADLAVGDAKTARSREHDEGTEKSNGTAGALDSQDEKRAFLAAHSRESPLSSHAVIDPISPYQIMAGTVIPAALITGIDSDLPGQILASVTEPVYDSRTGQHLLIPQGARLIGEYDSQVAFGQRRVLLVWNRLIFPDASSIALDRLQGVDTAGRAGLADGIDRHWRELVAGAALSSILGIGAELAAPDRSNGTQIVVATRQSLQDSINQVGQEATRKNLDLQPTLTIRPGFPVRVIVAKDLVLRPYQPLFVRTRDE